MSLMVVLLRSQPTSPVLNHEMVGDLARIGVTDITLARGSDAFALVVNGWSFDGRRHEDRVLALVRAGDGATVLHQLADLTLLPDQCGPDVSALDVQKPPSTQRSTP